MNSFNDIITNLLQNLGSRREIEQYLREFSNVESTKFAIIKVGGAILDESLDELASSLAFLRTVGLFPIVIHGAGPQLNNALQNAGIESTRIDGLRVTTPEVLAVVRKTMHALNGDLVEALEARSVRARSITNGIFESRILDEEKFGYVGEVDRVDLEPIQSAIQAGQLPIVSCLGETTTGQILNINADIAARELALAVKPYKVIFLTETGGLLDEHGEIISAVNLVEDYDSLQEQHWVNGGMRLKLQEIKRLLDALPAETSVSITQPEHLACELFTHRGSGTLVRAGESVELHQSFEQVDCDRLSDLIHTSFGRPLRQDYFESHEANHVLVTQSYSATAILTLEEGLPYLDKFAVTARAQGSGLGGSIWAKMKAVAPCLFWRARPDNPIAAWYFQQADGMRRTDDWVVYWYGFHDDATIARCVEIAMNIPPSLVEVCVDATIESGEAVHHA